jgi:hypothetical protein
MHLPDHIYLDGREYPLDYAFEAGVPVVRARVPVKVLNYIDEEDLPELDRPLHWTVTRGKEEAIRAATLAEARDVLANSPREPRAHRRRREPGEGGRGPTGRGGGERKGRRGGQRNKAGGPAPREGGRNKRKGGRRRDG